MNFIQIVNELNDCFPEKYNSFDIPLVFSYLSDDYSDHILFGEIILWNSENCTADNQDEILETVIENFNNFREMLNEVQLPLTKRI